jgi:hypothetical protein
MNSGSERERLFRFVPERKSNLWLARTAQSLTLKPAEFRKVIEEAEKQQKGKP